MPHKNVIPEETMKIIWDFFMKTSIPRLLEKKRKEEQKILLEKAKLEEEDE